MYGILLVCILVTFSLFLMNHALIFIQMIDEINMGMSLAVLHD